MGSEKREFEYIVVGSGAGGGPLAANLAEAGHDVLLLEAGGEHEPITYQVPAYHANSTEDPLLEWSYFCRHYTDNPERDKKHRGQGLWDDGRTDLGGILYPRAGTLGGCTAHHAMICVYPHRGDWEGIANLMGDESWRPDEMREHFDRIHRTEFADASDFLAFLNPGGILDRLHQSLQDLLDDEDDEEPPYTGWLPVNQADFTLLAKDKQLKKLLVSVIKNCKREGLKLMPALNPNVRSVERKNGEGMNLIPINTSNGRRAGTRERINAVRNTEGSTLTVRTNRLVTKVLFDDGDPPTATGVQCWHGEHLYEADPAARQPSFEPSYTEEEYVATKEVILAGGAFNTPQILMLSGVGPRQHLEEHGIDVKVAREGVGTNLQDRYEVGVVYELAEDHVLLKDATFGRPQPDPELERWRDGKGPYTTNGALLGIIKKSQAQKIEPDLYIFGVPGYFEGYYVGYSADGFTKRNRFTWAVLKGHTENRGGEVKLRSANPRDMPEIHFKYFDEGSGDWKDDADSVVRGIEFTDKIMRDEAVVRRITPTDEDMKDLRKYVTDNAWGHHASCTCPMGPATDPRAVVDSKFRVHGTKNLRIVDASVFPRIPGLFILSSVYTISEKASRDILEEAGG